MGSEMCIRDRHSTLKDAIDYHVVIHSTMYCIRSGNYFYNRSYEYFISNLRIFRPCIVHRKYDKYAQKIKPDAVLKIIVISAISITKNQ